MKHEDYAKLTTLTKALFVIQETASAGLKERMRQYLS